MCRATSSTTAGREESADGALYRRRQKMADGTIRADRLYWWIRYYQNGRPVRESTGTTRRRWPAEFSARARATSSTASRLHPKMGRVYVRGRGRRHPERLPRQQRRSLDGVERRFASTCRRSSAGGSWRRSRRPTSGATSRSAKADVIVTGTGETEKTRPVSNAEINNELKVLRRMFSLAVEAGKVGYKPEGPDAEGEQRAHRDSSSPSSSTPSVGICPRTCGRSSRSCI